jgi:HAD superfamily hydrolase (TIGR01549 family)
LTKQVLWGQDLLYMRHWVFDFDGTLVDSEGYFSESFRYALAPFNIRVERDFIERIRHKHPHRIFEDILTEDQSRQAFERMNEVAQGIADKISLFPGITEILEHLDRSQVSLSIWTGRDQESTQLILGKQGIGHVFKKIITGTCVENNKPSHDGLLEICQFYQAPSQEVVMVGDHHHDIEPANALGCYSIHAQWKNNPHILPPTIQPKTQFQTTQDLLNWVRENIA